jgi:hypothetical protein
VPAVGGIETLVVVFVPVHLPLTQRRVAALLQMTGFVMGHGTRSGLDVAPKKWEADVLGMIGRWAHQLVDFEGLLIAVTGSQNLSSETASHGSLQGLM